MIFQIIFVCFFSVLLFFYINNINFFAIKRNELKTLGSKKMLRIFLLPILFLSILVYKIIEIIKFYF